MRGREKLVAAAAAALFAASVAGSFLVGGGDQSDLSGSSTTSTLPELATTTTLGLPEGPPTSTTEPSTASSLAPVASTTTTAPKGGGGTTSTTAAAGTGLAAPSKNTAPCPPQPATPKAAGGQTPVAASVVAVVTADGGEVRYLSETGRTPQWRAGASEVVYVETAPGKDPALCVQNTDTAAIRPITTPVGADGPVLSPDGSQVAVRAGVGGPRVALVVGPVDGSTRRAVLEGTDVKDPTWLGNGTVVACLTPSGASPRLVKVPAAGGSVTTVRDSCPGPASGSPDGSRLAIPSASGLEVIESSGKVITLPRAGILPQPPSWSPGSDQLVYGYTDEQGRALGLFDIGKSVANQIARAEADQPAYSPKGDRIFFTGRTTPGTVRRILSVAPTGGNVRAVADCQGRCLLPRSAWDSAGTKVVVESSPGS